MTQPILSDQSDHKTNTNGQDPKITRLQHQPQCDQNLEPAQNSSRAQRRRLRQGANSSAAMNAQESEQAQESAQHSSDLTSWLLQATLSIIDNSRKATLSIIEASRDALKDNPQLKNQILIAFTAILTFLNKDAIKQAMTDHLPNIFLSNS